MQGYSKYYMRKNSKHPCKVLLRCHHLGMDKRNFRYYLELWVNGKMKDQTLIMAEAYDALSCDPKLKKEELKNLEFITLMEFTPEKNSNQNQ